ncbi:MocR-like pyridoxine biosynthesis transcription factor PdxR [Thermaerobacillus caldiproteolyticus]|uniref:MocR-like pyridoxine biosynthesis transcription factor PdxR n=1 Tax=Thermaerobacillus caldiproteolyticus TaxID=247480 RepID=UPI001F2061E6|nr:PLP-dependent aminotransferase family protein [Anoxybacillus caldiproteolyticus]
MIELSPVFDTTTRIPLYIQLYEYLKTEIINKNIAKGSKLPSIRALSKHLGISKNTVEGAYQQLLAEGYIESKPRVGFIVKELEEPLVPSLSETQQHSPMPPAEQSMRYDFRYGHIDTTHFPMKAWRKCMNEALEMEPEKILWYGERKGDFDLRREIKNYLYQARGILCSPEQIIIGSGIQQLTSLICQLFDSKTCAIAMENPSYDGIRSVFLNHHFQVLPISLEEDGLNIEELETSNANVVYVTPSHQLPLGMVLPIGKRQKLLKWAAKNSAWIIEDDYDSEFRYESQPIPALKALDMQNRVIYLGTFSKVLTPSIRVSYMVLPNCLLERFSQIFYNYNQPVSTIIQKTLYLFMKYGYFERHIRKMRHTYAKKQQTLITAIREYFGDNATVIGEKAGLHLLMNLKNYNNVDELVIKAEKAGIKVYSAAKYWFGKSGTPPSYVLLGFGGMNEKDIIDGVRLLKKVWLSNK